MYGPTETTIWSSVSRMDEKPEVISLGLAVANTQLSIVDSRRQPMPIAAIGELLIGGKGVVRGYWHRGDLTAEKFLTGYPAYTSAEKVYATGDLARYLPDGRLIFLGRNDFQVKVRGYRIELEEIETVLLQQPGIAEAVVHPVVYSGAEPRLVGYYTVATSGEPVTSTTLKEALHSVLPPFMVPNAFVKLDSFPLTPNAKIDRKALPLPTIVNNQDNEAANEELESASDLERQVLKIWQDILGTSQFGLDDNFFDHGGHSLLVVDVMTRVRPLFTKQIKLIDLFRYPQVRQLVEHLSETNNAGETAVIAGAQSRAAARRAARRR
jgi:non-ribosomal peptide synthetase component F